MTARVTSSRPVIVVGVDGSPGALQAVRWAAVEAAGRSLPLSLVFADDPMCDAGLETSIHRESRVADTVLAEASRQAILAEGSVEVMTEVVRASPAVALARNGGYAAMICLGFNGVRTPHPGHRIGTATEVVLTADCPVVVVRGPAPCDGWAVAWMEADPSLADVLHLAVDEAVLRGLPLRLLTNWTVRTAEPNAVDLDRRLRHDLDRWRRRYPHLDAAVVADPDPSKFLSCNAGRIALFVAPPRQAHDVGTVIHAAAETATRMLGCPVIISTGVGGAGLLAGSPVIHSPPRGAHAAETP